MWGQGYQGSGGELEQIGVGACDGLNSVPSKNMSRSCPSPRNVILFEAILGRGEESHGNRAGPDLSWLVSSQAEDIWTQTQPREGGRDWGKASEGHHIAAGRPPLTTGL